ncbi:integrase, catalytic region, zinc finger, CCHC-type containing protein [Tanacetum coccineum]|uniref:Integrase, catalytic region, zinc finger, CCHC-type containing protein n=1 Tax=Tanacetum coccineum TaxID=301880 RepID=A0ABQ5DP80_9ASTR
MTRDECLKNVSSGLVPQGQKASDYDNSDPVPPRQNVVPTAEKTDSSQQGLEFLFSPLLDDYYNPTHGLAEENNNDQAPNASFQEDEFINPFCTRVQEIGESSSRTIDNTDVHSFQPQSHDYRWTRDHPLEQVRGNPTMPVQTRRQLATDPEMCMFALTVSIVEPKNIKEAMADSAWIEAMQDELHQFDRLKVWELVDKPFGKMVIKLKWLWKNKKDEDQTVIRNKARLVAKGYAHEERTSDPPVPKGYFYQSGQIEWSTVDQSDYRSKMGQLMYLTSSRPDLVQAVCYCARYQARPTQKHLKETLNQAGLLDTRKAFWRDTVLGDKLVENGIIELYFVRTEYQLADMFTKALPEDRFKYLVRRIGMRCLTPAELEVLTNESA